MKHAQQLAPLVAALVASQALTLGAPGAAYAGHPHEPIGCLVPERGGVLGTEGSMGNTAHTTMRGNRMDLLTPDRTATCQQISSIYIHANGGGFVEAGWVMGWSNCDRSYHHEPTAFIWVRNNGGANRCQVFTGRRPSQGNDHTWRISDLNSDTFWGAWLDGSELTSQPIDMNFSQGSGAVGMERGNATDSGYTRFRNMEEYHAGNGWSPWNDLTPDTDSDPDYHLRVDSGDSGATVQ